MRFCLHPWTVSRFKVTFTATGTIMNYFGKPVNVTMDDSINYRIDDDRIGMIKMSASKVEFMMITKEQSWETSMTTEDFVDGLQNDYGVPVPDAVAALVGMINYKGFVIEDDVMTLYMKRGSSNVHVKFPPFGDPRPSPSFMWAAVSKDATAYANARECERAEEERKRIEEQKIAEALALQKLKYEYKRWKKKHPIVLVGTIPEQFAPLFVA